MTLEKYNEKRDFKKTPEHSGQKNVKTDKSIYLIHEHHASHLHWDLRLEMEGTLKSWAVPKEPSINPSVKRLAIMVEDHPLKYAKFEGVIPEGQYGAGTVKIWDKGTFELIEKTEKGFVIKIDGKKLKGTFVLFRFKPPNNWLFFKKRE